MQTIFVADHPDGPTRRLVFEHQRWRSVPRMSPWVVYRFWGALAIHSGVAEYAKAEPEPIPNVDEMTAVRTVTLNVGSQRVVHRVKAIDSVEEIVETLVEKARA